MIHSMSGGVLSDNEVYTFVKVEVEGAPCWYLAPDHVQEGALVLVPHGYMSAQGRVLKVERCTQQTAPVPMKCAREILALL